MDRQQRSWRHFAGVQSHVATYLWWCNESFVLTHITELQSCFAQLLSIEPSWCRLLAHEPTHESDEPCWPIRRGDKSTVLACFPQVLVNKSQLQSCQSGIYTHFAGLLAYVPSDGGSRRCQELQPNIACVLAHLAAVLACFARIFADVATVLSCFPSVLPHVTAVLSNQSSDGRCIGPWRSWCRRRCLAAS